MLDRRVLIYTCAYIHPRKRVRFVESRKSVNVVWAESCESRAIKKASNGPYIAIASTTRAGGGGRLVRETVHVRARMKL